MNKRAPTVIAKDMRFRSTRTSEFQSPIPDPLIMAGRSCYPIQDFRISNFSTQPDPLCLRLTTMSGNYGLKVRSRPRAGSFQEALEEIE
jgi:hypothetical protein